MNVSVFKRNFEWIVIVDYHAITFHQTFADAMRHASTQIRSANNSGAVTQIISLSTTGDLQRAAMFLEGAREVRNGSRTQRSNARQAQATAWKKKVDNSVTW